MSARKRKIKADFCFEKTSTSRKNYTALQVFEFNENNMIDTFFLLTQTQMEKTGLIDSFYSAGKSDSSVETRIRSRFSWPLHVFSGLSDSKDADLTSNAVFF